VIECSAPEPKAPHMQVKDFGVRPLAPFNLKLVLAATNQRIAQCADRGSRSSARPGMGPDGTRQLRQRVLAHQATSKPRTPFRAGAHGLAWPY
jgi:hypothetical protein